MKKLVCEMCGGTNLLKQDGVFVCQDCGTKYSVEEARKMMVEGTVDIRGTVTVDNSAQVKNYLDLSQNAYDSANGQSAFDYANKALEIDPQNPRAWISKMKSIEYLATLGDLKLVEMIEAGKNAVAYASEEEKVDITHEVYYYELTHALSLLKLAMQKMSDTAEIEATFKKFALISILSAAKNTKEIDDVSTSIYDKVATEAMSLAELVPDEVLANYSDLAHIAGQCALQYQYETDAFQKRLKIYGAYLLDSSIKNRDNKKKALEDKASAAEKIALEREAKAKEERKEAYWLEHSAEKIALEGKKRNAQSLKAELELEIQQLPENNQIKEISTRIAEMENQLRGLGFFKMKEKKALQAQIDEVHKTLVPIEKAFEDKKSSIQAKIDEQDKIISEIDTELEMDR